MCKGRAIKENEIISLTKQCTIAHQDHSYRKEDDLKKKLENNTITYEDVKSKQNQKMYFKLCILKDPFATFTSLSMDFFNKFNKNQKLLLENFQ